VQTRRPSAKWTTSCDRWPPTEEEEEDDDEESSDGDAQSEEEDGICDVIPRYLRFVTRMRQRRGIAMTPHESD